MSYFRDIVYLLFAVISSPFWLYRLLRTGKWRTDWPARFGRSGTTPQDRPTLLLHAVSVGEVNAIRQLVDELARRHGDKLRIVVSATTDTGIARARQLFEPAHTVVRYPLDFTFSVRRFLRHVRPTAVALVELEVWPTFVSECHRRNIPVVVINGRLSERSFRRYQRIRPLFRATLARLHAVAAQDETYALRFRDLGVALSRVFISGTMKWDTAVIRDDVPGSAELAAAMGIDRSRPLVVCGSTGDGEEEMIVDALRDVDTQLLIAPRKPERFASARIAMLNPVLRTQCPDGAANPVGRNHFLLDTLGELGKAYSLADVVIVGRTFAPMGGSDLIEPIALGKATIVGPHVENFANAVHLLRAGRGIVQLDSILDLEGAVRDLLADPLIRRGYAHRSREIIRKQQGATSRTADLLDAILRNADKL
ncbi:MAG TPA: glycosyltransferase N-terminal domain-containing protein [Planctomycetota bacterium]|nr:glycosyltransferase N-terminal domain-containing protein [Planctomycetota bacterium]